MVESQTRILDHKLLTGLACGRNVLKLATTPQELESVLRLRFEVFNRELGEGIPENEKLGMDVDEFDTHCDHLLIMDGELIVGTYRLLHGPRRPAAGFYSQSEFNFGKLLDDLPLQDVVEMGRGCIHPNHRKKTTLMGLFWGLHHYIKFKKARYLLGCSSLPQMSHEDAEGTFRQLCTLGAVKFPEGVGPLPKNSFQATASSNVNIPPLVSLYLEFGAKILGRPAYDPVFRCHDLFTFLDTEHLTQWGVELLERFDRRLLAGAGREV